MRDQEKLESKIELWNLLTFQLAGHLWKPYNISMTQIKGEQMETDCNTNTSVEGEYYVIVFLKAAKFIIQQDS